MARDGRLAGAACAVGLALLAALACGGEDRPRTETAAEAPQTDGPGVDVDTLRQLDALGYAEWHPAPAPLDRGVTLDRSADRDGFVLYTSRPRKSAELIRRDGSVVHRWERAASPASWQHVEWLPGGDLLVIAKDHALLRLDADSRVELEVPIRVHHDVAMASDGRIVALVRRLREVPFGARRVPILDDLVVELSPDGEVLNEISLFDALGHLVPDAALARIAEVLDRGGDEPVELGPSSVADLFHTNSLELVSWKGSPVESALLLSIRNLSRIVVLDRESGRLRWQWGEGVVEQQHHATLEADGRILLFDNAVARGASRILTVDPATGTHEVVYEAPKFYTRRRGSVERLPDGGLLVAESVEGRILEVAPDGSVVWEFLNADVRPGKNGRMRRAAIYRAARVPREQAEAAFGGD